MSYVFPPDALVTPVLYWFLAEHVTGQLRYIIPVAPLMDGNSLALSAMLEKMVRLVCSIRCNYQFILYPKFADFWLHLFGIQQVWHITDIYYSAMLAFLKHHHHHHYASNHPIISR